MTLVESLPPRPLSPKELTGLNTADAFELAVSVESDVDEQRSSARRTQSGDGDARSLLLATNEWVKGLAFDEEGGTWTVVETVSLDGRERLEGLQACEEAVWAFRGETDDDSDTAADPDGDDSDGDAESA
ncbi:hypothetical protein [Halopelagius fulvigenes]|uniref:DUF7964 domain-containing protein n=1 Tax=Halopelagius fulvigenes TaxID=1198324 RepID=A0ABD5U0X5_9EURY